MIREEKQNAKDLERQSQYSQFLLDSTIDSYIVLDDQGDIFDINQAYCDLIGYSREELLQMNIRQLDVKVPGGEADKIIQEVLSKGEDRFETDHKHKDGKLVNLEASLRVLHFDEKPMIAAFMRDISDRKRAMEALSDSEYLLRKSQEVARLGSYILDFTNGIWDSSAILNEIFGIDEDYITDVPGWLQIIHPDDRELMEDYFGTLLTEKQQIFDKEYRIIRIDDQRERWVHGLGEFEYLPDGTLVKMIGTIQDISERKQAEEGLLKMSKAINNSSEVVLITDREGIITYVNPEFTRMYGYSAEELVGKVTPRILKSGHADKEITEYMWKTLLSKQSIPASQYVNRCKDGSFINIEGSADPIIGENGAIIGFLGVQRDISKRKRTEQIQSVLFHISNAANTSTDLNQLIAFIQKELGEVIDTTNFYVALYDENADLLSFPSFLDENDQVKSIQGGKTLDNYVIKTQEPMLLSKAEIKKMLQTGLIETQEKIVEQWLGVPLKFKGKVTGVLAVQSYTDALAFNEADMQMLDFVSEQISVSIYHKKAEQDLIVAFEKATESDRLKSAFLASMSHELRTPLNAIIGFSDIIKRDLAVDEMISYAKIINSSGHQLLSIVEDLFDITLIEAGEVKIRKREEKLYSIMEYVHEIIEVERQSSSKGHLEFKLAVAPEERDIIIHTDSVKLKQILINLLKNALKFTTEGHVHFGYQVEKDKNKTVIKFYVEDTGQGIPEDKRELIFDVFRQIEDSNTRALGGTGIGLSIARKMTELLGGRIWLESIEGEGSVFYFTIPLDGQEGEAGRGRSEIEAGGLKRSSKTRRKVLIVEDDEPSLNYLKILLGKDRLETDCVNSGLEAIKYCKENANLDLILMDINMPEMDGYEATREIKKFMPDLPIIAQTANAVEGDKEKVLEAGCDDYISKPIKKEVLWAKIEKHLKITKQLVL